MSLLVKFRKTVIALTRVLVILSITFGFIYMWQKGYREALFFQNGNYLVVAAFMFILLTFVKLYGGLRIGVFRLHELWYSLSIAIVFSNALMYFVLCLIAREILSLWPLLFGVTYQIIIAGIDSYCANSIYFSIYHARHILAISGGEKKQLDIIKKMSRIPERYSVDKSISADEASLEEIYAEIDKYEAILIFDFDVAKKDAILRYCYAKRKRIYLVPSTNDIILNSAHQSQISDTPVLMCRNHGLTMEQMIMKRIMDIVVSGIMLIVASPIMLVTAIAIKLGDGGHVFFKQNRVTRDGKIFNVLKFRSMYESDNTKDLRFARKNDDRITPVGKVIRACRVDELPQLINVLKGDMSLVGPRPERSAIVYEFTKEFPEFDLRHRVKGGLTGYAQIYGKYNTTPKDKLKMDLMYIEKYSILLDIKLLFMTFKILFMKESTEGFENEEERTEE